jgi:hypothetical protein
MNWKTLIGKIKAAQALKGEENTREKLPHLTWVVGRTCKRLARLKQQRQ